MPTKKWIFQYSIAFPILSALFSSVQYIKGQTVSYSARLKGFRFIYEQ